MKKLVGYGFSLPSKSSLFHMESFDLLEFLFDGRLKPYPTNVLKLKNMTICHISHKIKWLYLKDGV